MIRTEDYKRELVSIVFAQKHLIFWTAFITFVGAVIIAFYWPPTFSSMGSILVSGKQLTADPHALAASETRLFEVTKEDLTSEVQILTSPDVIRNAIEYIAVAYPEVLEKEGQKMTAAEAVYSVGNNLRTEIIPASNVIEITYLNKNAGMAVKTLDVIMEQYIIFRMRHYDASTGRLSPRFLSDQVERIRDELSAKDDQLIALVNETMVAEPEQEILNNIILKKSLEAELNQLTNGLIETRAHLEQLENALENKDFQYFSFVDSQLINDLSIKLAELSNERRRVGRTYHAESDVVQSIDSQIESTFASLKLEVSSHREDMRKRQRIYEDKIARTEETLAEYDRKNVQLQEQLINTAKINREADVLKFSFDTLSKRKESASVEDLMDKTDKSTYVSILSRAFPSDGPVFPRKAAVIPIGLIVGLLTGCCLGFVREYFDHTFKKPSDVQMYADLPVLFSLARPDNRIVSILYYLVTIALVLCVLAFLLGNMQIADFSLLSTG